jgi:hypothetical protein
MTSEYAQTKSALWALSREIYEYAYERYPLPNQWDGAEVYITSKLIPDSVHSYAERFTIVSPAAREVAWLFRRLRDAFASVVTGASRVEFYGRLARAIEIHQTTVDREHKLNSMLRAAMSEAFAVLEEMEKGTFQALSRTTDRRLPLV